MAGWGHTQRLSLCGIAELRDILKTLRNGGQAGDYDRVASGGYGMSTIAQQKYAIVLYHAYCSRRQMPREEWGQWMHNWLQKYWKVGHVRWATERQMHTILGALERMIITTPGDAFGVKAYEEITGRTWPETGDTYRKYKEERA